MTVAPTHAIKVFYSYAHQDEYLREELEKHLMTLKRGGLITTWYDRKITAGMGWPREIDIHLNIADIILFLISPDFVASDYCYDIEVKRALERHEAGEAIVIPVILRPVYWGNTPFSKLQALPKDGKPIYKSGRYSRDKAFLDVALGIQEVVEVINKRWYNPRSDKSIFENRDTSAGDFESSPLNTSIALVQVKRGDTLYENAEYTLALMSYSLATTLDPDYALAYIGKGNTLYALKHYQSALKVFEQALRLDPLNPTAYNGKGNSHYALKHLDEALDAYEEALRLEGNNADTYTCMLHALETFSCYNEILAVCEQRLRLVPDHAAANQLKLLLLRYLD